MFAYNLFGDFMKNKFIWIFRIISVVIIFVCVVLLIFWSIENHHNESIQADLLENVEIVSCDNSADESLIDALDNISSDEIYKVDVDLDSLCSANSDLVGWIKIDGTNIDYPIVQADNNSYYLNHNFEKRFNRAGWIFADYRNSFDSLNQNTIIYGHNRRNGIMFSNLKNYYDNNLTNNKYFSFRTRNCYYMGEIFSVYKVDANYADIPITFESSNSFQSYLDDWLRKSKYDFNTSVDTNYNILTLCTCDNSSSYRIIIHAKLVQIY